MTTVKFTAKDVAALRARTGAGMGDCKKALEEALALKSKLAETQNAIGIEERAQRSSPMTAMTPRSKMPPRSTRAFEPAT